MDRGPVTGFVISWSEAPEDVLYVSGDTVWFEGTTEVARHFKIRTAILFMGAARVPEITPHPLTMTASDGIAAAGISGCYDHSTSLRRLGTFLRIA